MSKMWNFINFLKRNKFKHIKMKKTIYLLFILLWACLLPDVHAQGLYGTQEENEESSSTPYAPSILRGEPDLPPPPGEGEEGVPLGEGVLLLAALAGARCTVRGARRKTKR